MGSKSEMLRLKNELMENRIIIQFINYIGSGDDGVLRIVVFSTHTSDQIDNLIYQLKKII
jgi:7-keto-8-aminopelargonate synthetase-like enzyme